MLTKTVFKIESSWDVARKDLKSGSWRGVPSEMVLLGYEFSNKKRWSCRSHDASETEKTGNKLEKP